MPVRLRRRAQRLAAVTVALLALPGCSNLSQLSFRNDHRLSFVAPADRELIALPLELRWSMAGEHNTFAVFVDRAPVKPGETLRAVVGRDSRCKRTPTCPDAAYLADRGVYTTTSTSIVIERVAPLVGKPKVQLHRATIVLLGPDGRRVGEAAWEREFKLRKRTF